MSLTSRRRRHPVPIQTPAQKRHGRGHCQLLLPDPPGPALRRAAIGPFPGLPWRLADLAARSLHCFCSITHREEAIASLRQTLGPTSGVTGFRSAGLGSGSLSGSGSRPATGLTGKPRQWPRCSARRADCPRAPGPGGKVPKDGPLRHRSLLSKPLWRPPCRPPCASAKAIFPNSRAKPAAAARPGGKEASRTKVTRDPISASNLRQGHVPTPECRQV